MLARLSLRARLMLGVIALAALGLAVADVATYASLSSFLIQRTDQSLAAAQAGGGDHGHGMSYGGCGRGDLPPPGSRPGDLIQIRSLDGTVLCSNQTTPIDGSTLSPPQLPATIAAPSSGDPDGARYFTTPAQDGSGRYRLRVSVEPGSSTMLVAATPLTDVDATLRQLLWIELLVTAVVLVALAPRGLWVVRLGLRPLDAIGATAAAIGAGDLSRRVEPAEPRTEVGRLGLALNGMLGQIEAAFAAREESERKLRRFVADASHELRTPLAAVRAYAELFTRGADRRPADLARSMQGIARESERMSLLVNDLLLLARLDEGRPLRREPVELDDVVEEAVETALAVEPERPIKLERGPARVIGDRERLRQIVDNLLANVRAHTPAGSPVWVRVVSVDGTAVVEVEDSGPGLNPLETERVFERFYRADRSRARASGGAGLGLSIVSAVTEAHGGSVGARSELGRGAMFSIKLPLAAETHSQQLEREKRQASGLPGEEPNRSASLRGVDGDEHSAVPQRRVHEDPRPGAMPA
jgi:two-component system, OmpR family, sensor kinase